MGKIPCSNRSAGKDTILYITSIRRQDKKLSSNIRSILRIHSGTEDDRENILKNIYWKNISKNFDIVDDCVCLNGHIRYDS